MIKQDQRHTSTTHKHRHKHRHKKMADDKTMDKLKALRLKCNNAFNYIENVFYKDREKTEVCCFCFLLTVPSSLPPVILHTELYRKMVTLNNMIMRSKFTTGVEIILNEIIIYCLTCFLYINNDYGFKEREDLYVLYEAYEFNFPPSDKMKDFDYKKFTCCLFGIKHDEIKYGHPTFENVVVTYHNYILVHPDDHDPLRFYLDDMIRGIFSAFPDLNLPAHEHLSKMGVYVIKKMGQLYTENNKHFEQPSSCEVVKCT